MTALRAAFNAFVARHEAAWEVVNHSQISLTMNTYSHVIPALQRDAADQMEALLAGGAE